MSLEVGNSSIADEEVDLRELFATLWAGKWLILAITCIFAAASLFYALYKPEIYQASVLLAPAQDSGSSRISNQLSGLASLAGVNLGGGDANKTTIATEVLKSRAFLTDFIHSYNLSEELMATESWDNAQQEWEYRKEVFNPATEEWGTDEDGKSLKPTDWDLVKTFKEKLSVIENKENGMVTVSLKSRSPSAAQKWVEWLVNDLNEHMRTQDIREAEASIDYLESKLRETNIAGMQQVFYQLIENETRTVMLANAQPEYVFKTIDPAVVPQEKIEPNRTLIVFLSSASGGILGVFTVLFWAFINSGKKLRERLN